MYIFMYIHASMELKILVVYAQWLDFLDDVDLIKLCIRIMA